MSKKDVSKTLDEIAIGYPEELGVKRQLMKCAEECAELNKAILKYLGYEDMTPTMRTVFFDVGDEADQLNEATRLKVDIVTEATQVLIMIRQLQENVGSPILWARCLELEVNDAKARLDDLRL